MNTDSRDIWIDHFVAHATRMGTPVATTALMKIAEQLWYSFHHEATEDIACLWVAGTLPEAIQRDAWVAACSHRLSFFNQQMEREESDALARTLYGIERLRTIGPDAAADAWALEHRAPATH